MRCKKQLQIVEKFAQQHGKLLAVTETGAANDPAPGDNQTALLRSGNGNKDWYNQVLDIVSDSQASYYLLWANFAKADGFYTPYVDTVNEDGSLHGHEMLDNFISFYNDGRSIFAANGSGFYTAKLTANQLKTLGRQLGTLALYIDGKKVQSIPETYNVKAPKEDPYLIDGFENYYGVDDQLSKAWTVNADTDCKVSLSLAKDRKSEGDYGLKFTYDETENGWAGATISKEVDWSGCNALQFYMLPDGKKQKTVIQINAGGVTCEVYLNNYKTFVENGKKPVQVTIPFAEFCERDTEDNPKGGLVDNSKNIQSFGLWVNAVPGSSAISGGRVKGTMYYDQITAVKSSAEKVVFKAAK